MKKKYKGNPECWNEEWNKGWSKGLWNREMCVIKTRVSVNIRITLFNLHECLPGLNGFYSKEEGTWVRPWQLSWMTKMTLPPSSKPNYLFSKPIALLFPGIYQYIPLSINNISLLFTNYEFVPHLTKLRFVYS